MLDFSRSLYFHREGKGILTGQSNNGEKPGFDQSIDHAWTEQHLENAMWRFPLLAKAGLLREWAGLYEVTPDAHPVIDTRGRSGWVHYCRRLQRARLHARPRRRAAGGRARARRRGARHSTLRQLRFSRFAEGDLVTEHNVV